MSLTNESAVSPLRLPLMNTTRAKGSLPRTKRRSEIAKPWRRAKAEFDAACQEYDRLGQVADQADKAVEADAPMPTILRRINGGTYFTEQHILDERGLSFDEKVERVCALREWLPRFAAAKRKHGSEKAHDVWEAYNGQNEAFRALVNTPAPDADALSYKIRLCLKEVHAGYIRQDVDTPETISEFLTAREYDGPWPLARIYQDVLRFAGARQDLAAVQPFDAKRWLEEFEALPGHRMTSRGPCYIEPDAWGSEATPSGHHQWNALAEWQKDIVKAQADDF